MVVKSASANFTNGRIQVAVAKLQHNSKPVRSYVSDERSAGGIAGSWCCERNRRRLFAQAFSAESRINGEFLFCEADSFQTRQTISHYRIVEATVPRVASDGTGSRGA